MTFSSEPPAREIELSLPLKTFILKGKHMYSAGKIWHFQSKSPEPPVTDDSQLHLGCLREGGGRSLRPE